MGSFPETYNDLAGPYTGMGKSPVHESETTAFPCWVSNF